MTFPLPSGSEPTDAFTAETKQQLHKKQKPTPTQ